MEEAGLLSCCDVNMFDTNSEGAVTYKPADYMFSKPCLEGCLMFLSSGVAPYRSQVYALTKKLMIFHKRFSVFYDRLSADWVKGCWKYW